jgi:hypothetical protein
VHKGSRSSIVNASITNSRLWQHVALLRLHSNMRLLNPSLQGDERNELEELSKWVLAIGDGTVPAIKRGKSVMLRGLLFLMIC